MGCVLVKLPVVNFCTRCVVVIPLFSYFLAQTYYWIEYVRRRFESFLKWVIPWRYSRVFLGGGEGYPNMLPEYFFAIRAQRFELSCSQTSIRNDVIPQHTYLYAVVIRTQRRTSIAIWNDGPKENLPRQSCHDSWHKALRRYREIGLSSSLILYWYAECYFVGP